MTLPAELALFLVVWQIITSRYLWKLQRNFLTRTRHPFPFLPSFCHLGFQKNHLWNRWKLSFVTFSRVQGSSWKMPGAYQLSEAMHGEAFLCERALGTHHKDLLGKCFFKGKQLIWFFFSPIKRHRLKIENGIQVCVKKKIIVKAINEINSITEASSAPAQHSGIGEHLWGHTGLR